jgi:hypothetical protein
MSYIHTGKTPIVLSNDPVDPDSNDWLFFSYQDWLRDGETITEHTAVVTNGSIVTDSTYLGTMTDDNGTEFNEVYGVEFAVNSGAKKVTVTHRVTTTTVGGVDLGRTAIDHSAVLSVLSL